MHRSATLLLASALLAAACTGAPAAPATGDGDLGGDPDVTLPPIGVDATPGTGTLPSSDALVRVVNLYNEGGQQTLDVYGLGGSELDSSEIRVASVDYGGVTDWFDPGYVEGSGGDRTSSIAVHKGGDPKQLAGMSDATIVPGVRMTVIVRPPDTFGVSLRGAYDSRPETGRADVPAPIADKGVLVTGLDGMPGGASGDATYYASVGDFCLPGRFADPEIEKILGHPAPQPVGNDLVVPPGSHTLTIHRASGDPGDIPTCKDDPVASVPLDIAANGRSYVFLYQAPGDTKVQVLVVPFEP